MLLSDYEGQPNAVMEAIARLQRNPALVDSIFRVLATDELTKAQYGETEIAAAKRWFCGDGDVKPVELLVFMAYRIGEPKIPCITISARFGLSLRTTTS